MLIIRCPHCGPRDHTEFTYGGDATTTRPADDPKVPDATWHDFVYLRDNPRGVHRELWQHSQGCRSFMMVTRNTLTHEIIDTSLPHTRGDARK